MFLPLTLATVVPYLLGSIPFGYLLLRTFRGDDVRQVGSGNIGATNVARKSPLLGIATLVLDALKGFLAVQVMVAPSYFGLASSAGLEANPWENPLPALAAIFAIIGHIFPVWLKFKGGKGVATGVGAFLAIAPKAVGIVLIIFVAVVTLSRYVSLGSIAATAAFPLMVWLFYRYQTGPAVLITIMLASALIIYRHKDNIRRLVAGTENRFQLNRGAKA